MEDNRSVSWVLDFVAEKGPRIFGVSVGLYLLPLAGFVLAWLGEFILGRLSLNYYDIAYKALGVLGFVLGIGLVGSVVAPELRRRSNCNGRLLECRIDGVISELIRSRGLHLGPSSREHVLALMIVNGLIAIWLALKRYDELFVVAVELAAQGRAHGLIALLLNILSTSAFIVFWNIAAIALLYFLWVHHSVISVLSNAIRREMRGESILYLDSILKDILSQEKPALHFLRFRWRLMNMTSALNSMMRRALMLAIVLIVLSAPMDLVLKGYVTYVAISAVLIGVGLTIPAVWSLYTIVRWSNELQTLILIEFKNIRIKALERHNDTVVKASEELEYLVRELKHTLIQSRELWELIAALITLMATIVGVLAGIQW